TWPISQARRRWLELIRQPQVNNATAQAKSEVEPTLGADMGAERDDHTRRLSDSEKLESRRRIFSGQSFGDVSTAVGCSKKAIQRLLNATGGMPPRSTI